MGKQFKVTEATRQAFIDAFCELCKTMSIDKITIQAITKKAGYNRCTFYAYFNNVYDLLEHVENEVILHIKANIFDTIESIAVAETFIARLEDMQKGREKYFDVLLSDVNKSRFAARLKEAMIPAFMSQFNISGSDAKARYVLEFHLAGVTALMTQWIINGRDISLRQLCDVVRGVLSEGVLKTLERSSYKSVC